MTEIESLAILASIPNLGSAKIRSLLHKYGTAQNALNAPNKEIANLPGFAKIGDQWSEWPKITNWQHDLIIAEKQKAQLIPFTSPLFPKQLNEIPDPPALLYVQGELKPQDKCSISVIGTRNASAYGLEIALSISQSLASHGFTVISGLARGIDTAAHEGALHSGRTLGVLGSGLARIYPTENEILAKRIAEHGAIISEFPMETPPDRSNFPRRNRIVSGLSMGTLLIEAPTKGGAMMTMECALQQGKKLFTIPGRINEENFRGNHQLIKSGQAILIESVEDLIAHFDTLLTSRNSQALQKNKVLIDNEERALLQQITSNEVTIEELSRNTSLPSKQIQRILMSLMLKKIIKEYHGKIYKITAAGNTLCRIQ